MNKLRELAPAARGRQDAESRNLVFTFQQDVNSHGQNIFPRIFPRILPKSNMIILL